MKRKLGWCSIGVPDDWEDETTHQYLSPVGATVPLSDGGDSSDSSTAAVRVRSSVGISQVPLLPAATITEMVKTYIADLNGQLPQFQVLENQAWNHRELGNVPAFECLFEIAPAVTMHQAQLFIPNGANSVILAVFSCKSSHFESNRGEFQSILSSINPVG